MPAEMFMPPLPPEPPTLCASTPFEPSVMRAAVIAVFDETVAERAEAGRAARRP